MFKRIPAAVPPKIEIPAENKSVTIIRNYRLITPLMGGGVKAGENDPSFLIRPSSIRGQLRFWWRACFGGSEVKTDNASLLKDMFDRESAIFGQAAYYGENSSEPKKIIGKGASSIQIEVNVTNKGKTIQHQHRKKGLIPIYDIASPYSYAAFPLKDSHDPLINIEFTLTIRLNYAEHRDELEKVLWAWQTFGGIGARTRRGFGVLQRIDNQVDRYAFTNKEDLCDQIAKILTTRKYWPADVPHLSTEMRLHLAKPKPTPLETWADLLDQYKKFRQRRNKGNKPNRPGRSRWPEPDAVRRLIGKRDPDHEDMSSLDAYPRGEFGLPIIFQFTGLEKELLDQPELRLLEQKELSQQKGDRFASPMLLKPVASNGRLFGLIAVLEGSQLGSRQAIIKPRKGDSKKVRIHLTSAEAETIVTQTGKKILTNPSVITSFLETIEE